jgi:adenylylsulfate kinase
MLASDRGSVIWLTGLSGAGKTTISKVLAQRLTVAGYKVELLDGDVVRTFLSKGLGYSKPDRDENVRRIGFVAELLARNGVVVIVAAISPYREARQEVRDQLGSRFMEVYVRCPMSVLVQRDTKGLYTLAAAGAVEHLTGVSDPYEYPMEPEATVNTDTYTVAECADRIIKNWRRLQHEFHFNSQNGGQGLVTRRAVDR